MASRRRLRMLGVPVNARTTDQALAALGRIGVEADIAELRLDLMDELDLERLLADRPCPIIVTCRPPREGGLYRGSEESRLRLLQQAVRLGADYVDVELDSVARIGERGASRLIVSHHDPNGMPVDFAAHWRELRAAGADVVKLVGTASDVRQTLPVFEAYARADVPTIALAMGEAGLPTRVLALKYDACLLTYCSLEAGRGTARGQITLAEMLEVYNARQIGPATAVYGLLGPRVEADRLREYNVALRAAGMDAVAVPLVVSEGDAAETVAAFRELPVLGYHVQPPHQETVGQALDHLDPSACRSGQVNTVYSRDDELVGAWAETPPERVELWLATGGG